MPAHLRFTGAVESAPIIGKWLDAQPSELGSIARTWFAFMRRCSAEVRELMHDGCPTACVEDAPFAYVAVFKAHVNVGFFHGAALPDPARLLRGTGKSMRHVRIEPGCALEGPSLEELITASYRDVVARLKVAESENQAGSSGAARPLAAADAPVAPCVPRPPRGARLLRSG